MNFMNNNEDFFIVKDLKGFIDSTRALVFNSFGKDDATDELSLHINNTDINEINTILSFEESETICKELLKKQYNKKSKNTRYILNDDIFMSIIESLNDRMVSNILNGLVNKGLVETAYDDKSNDFIFWIKNENTNTN